MLLYDIPIGRYKRRAYFTSYIKAAPFMDMLRWHVDGAYLGRCMPNGGYVVVW